MLNITSATASAGSTPADIAAAARAAAGVARVDAAQAAKRPLAGIGAGAFTCEGAPMGFRTSEAAVLALPRLRRVAAAGAGSGLVGTGLVGTGLAGTGLVSTGLVATGLRQAWAGLAGCGTKAELADVKPDGVRSEMVSHLSASKACTSTISTQQFDNNSNQMTRSYPVIPGGVGPHPAREPDPV